MTVGLVGTIPTNLVLFLNMFDYLPSETNLVISVISYSFSFIFYFVLPCVVIGVPAALYFRFGLRLPLTVLVGALMFWGIVGGNTRLPFIFVLIQLPPMGALYGVVGTLEWYVRDRRGTLPSGPEAPPGADN